MSDIYQDALKLHAEAKGKLEVQLKVPLNESHDLSLAYTPGVAQPCREIAQNKDNVYKYTWKQNSVEMCIRDRPWTIPANLAICLNPDYTYALVQSEKGKLLVLEELVDSLWEKFGLQQKEILQRFSGKELETVSYTHLDVYKRQLWFLLKKN